MRRFGTAFSEQPFFPTGNGTDGGTNASSWIHGFSIGVNLSNVTDLRSLCFHIPTPCPGGSCRGDGRGLGRLLGQSRGTKAAADVKEEEKMAHGDKLPGNFYGASYSSLSRQLQLCSGLLSLRIAAPLWPPSYRVLLSSVQTHS